MDKKRITAGVLASKAGCNVETVRYYEKTGLMPVPARSHGGHRLYLPEHIKRLKFIRRCRELGFNIEQVKDMLKYIDESGYRCCDVKQQTRAHIEVITNKIEDLVRLKTALENMVSECEQENFDSKDCPIIETLYQ